MGKRILVIDDEEAVRDTFVLALSEVGYDIETAVDGLDGVARAEANPPELIFLDLRMPRMDGVETLRRLQRPGGCCADVPVCIVTAFQREFLQPLRKAADEGLRFRILDKPLTIEQVQTAARGILEGGIVG